MIKTTKIISITIFAASLSLGLAQVSHAASSNDVKQSNKTLTSQSKVKISTPKRRTLTAKQKQHNADFCSK